MSKDTNLDQSTQESKEGKETKLPELKFKEIAKSSEAVLETADGGGERVAIFHQQGDYTIVTDNGNKTKVINHVGRIEPLPDDNFSSDKKSIDIKYIKDFVKKRIIGGTDRDFRYLTIRGSHPRKDNIYVDEFPQGIKERITKKWKEDYGDADYLEVIYKTRMIEGIFFIENFNQKNNVSTIGSNFLLFVDDVGEFILLETKNKKGITVPLRQGKFWNNFTFNPEDNEPALDEEIREQIDKAVEGNKVIQPINAEYFGAIDGKSLQIYSTKDFKAGTSQPVYEDKLEGIGNNFVVDPTDQNIIYYTKTERPNQIYKLNLSGSPDSWQMEDAIIKNFYAKIRDLQLDPSGNFFVFSDGKDLITLRKDTLEEVNKMEGANKCAFDAENHLRVLDKEGYLKIYQTNFEEVKEVLDKERMKNLGKGISVRETFRKAKAKQTPAEEAKDFAYLQELVDSQKAELDDELSQAGSLKELGEVKDGLLRLKVELQKTGLKPREAEYVMKNLEAMAEGKKKELAGKEGLSVAERLEKKLQSGLALSEIGEARDLLNTIKPFESLFDEPLRKRLTEISDSIGENVKKLFTREDERIQKDVSGLLEKAQKQIESFTGKAQFDEWQENDYPQLRSQFYYLMRDCPPEASAALNNIDAAIKSLDRLADENRKKFEHEYAKVREKAAEKISTVRDHIAGEMTNLISILRGKGFSEQEQAEEYLANSNLQKNIQEQILALKSESPSLAEDLESKWEVMCANALAEVEHRSAAEIAESGEQIVMFGKTPFSRLERKTKELKEKQVELTFVADEKSKGPGVKAGAVMGDIGLIITHADGKKETLRLWEDEGEAEDSYRYGKEVAAMPSSYLSKAEFDAFLKNYQDWRKGDKSKLKQQWKEQREKLKEHWTKERKSHEGETIEQRAERVKNDPLLKEYHKFYQDNNIALLKKIDRVKEAGDGVAQNGGGFVPEWRTHWVIDPQTEKHLEKMAQHLKRQLRLGEGVLNLVGHAGTGKDVLVKMFCSKERGANRPYFATDCTRWTTEYELAEDIILEAEDGVSQTVKVPSAVLRGISTPGAMVYFNEVNAMPEQAQIFLHRLFDEGRSLTLKTSSGKTVKVAEGALLVSSMNPGYPGTFEPQFATKSRMVNMEIDYPPLEGERAVGDTNPNPPINCSEALRIARDVSSLKKMTYDSNLKRNKFVKLWDKEVNGIDNDAPEPTVEQKFDIEVILALVEWAKLLREEFKKNFEKTREARKALPVTQPLTGRELRRCADELSQIPAEEKVKLDAEKLARDLLKEFFLSYIYNSEDRKKIEKAMENWTSSKRPAK